MAVNAPQYPNGYGGATAPMPVIVARPDVQLLDPEFLRRVKQLMRASVKAGHPVGIGGAGRTTEQQTALFLARHHESPSGSIQWNGKRWALNAGAAPAAPPGLSYHEPTTPDGKALAADMVGDLVWLRGACGWFGLREFSAVNGEGWHVQPVEIPTSRSGYKSSMHPLPRWVKR